jgi:hypothetical protein
VLANASGEIKQLNVAEGNNPPTVVDVSRAGNHTHANPVKTTENENEIHVFIDAYPKAEVDSLIADINVVPENPAKSTTLVNSSSGKIARRFIRGRIFHWGLRAHQ